LESQKYGGICVSAYIPLPWSAIKTTSRNHGENSILYVMSLLLLFFVLTNRQVLQEEEAQRLEAAANRLRTQRLQAEERKKEREVKFTDRVPPAKRARPCKEIFA